MNCYVYVVLSTCLCLQASDVQEMLNCMEVMKKKIVLEKELLQQSKTARDDAHDPCERKQYVIDVVNRTQMIKQYKDELYALAQQYKQRCQK